MCCALAADGPLLLLLLLSSTLVTTLSLSASYFFFYCDVANDATDVVIYVRGIVRRRRPYFIVAGDIAFAFDIALVFLFLLDVMVKLDRLQAKDEGRKEKMERGKE